MPARTRQIRGARRLRSVLAASCVGSLVAGGIVLGVACGGTTGREGLVLPDASSPGDSTYTALDLDSGAFDVGILYADRVLPDVTAPPDAAGAAEGGFPWPDCPAFIPIDSDGDPVDPSVSIDQIPSVYDDAGQVVVAPDGSACADYPWLGSTATDECLTSSVNGPFPALPPCNWCVDAGVAAAGLRQGQSRYAICLDLYACIVDSGCAANGASGTDCLCGSDPGNCATDASGPCVAAELASLEYPVMSPDVLKNYENTAPGAAVFLGFCGGNLNSVLQATLSNGCFDAPDSSIDDTGTLSVDTGTASDGTLDSPLAESGIGDAGAADASDSEGALLPCTTASQGNCVPCTGNATGICTPAEAAFVQHDIDDGNATGDGGEGANGCYACLLMAGCLDDTEYGDHGIECGDLTGTFNAGPQAGTADSALCLATLGCILQTSCVAGGVSVDNCYCGPTHAGSACASAGSAVDGACLTPEVNGLGFGASDNTDILKNFDDNTRPAGMANQTFQCALANTCTSCLQ